MDFRHGLIKALGEVLVPPFWCVSFVFTCLTFFWFLEQKRWES